MIMVRKFISQTPRILLAAAALTCAAPTMAAAQIGGFETEITKKQPKERVKKQPIVDVRLDPSWKGPKSIQEALALVEDNGEIVVHPGTYAPESVSLRKSVSIRGIRDDYGRTPVLNATGACLTISKPDVSARISHLTFKATDRNCIAITAGTLEIQDSEILGKHFREYAVPAVSAGHLTPFTPEAATGSRSALVSIKGGRVRIVNSVLSGGETGVMISPTPTNASFSSVDLQGNTISKMTGAGVVMIGDVDVNLSTNTIVSNQLSGVVYAATGHARLVGNIISNNTNNGLYVQAMGEAVSIESNKIHDNSENGIEVRSGVAILVNNEIGEHQNCRVNPNAPKEGTSDHLSMPPITLLADPRGVTRYDTSEDCGNAKKKKRNSRRG